MAFTFIPERRSPLSGIRNHQEQVQHFEASDVHAECKYIFVPFDEVVVRQTDDIARVVEVAVTLA